MHNRENVTNLAPSPVIEPAERIVALYEEHDVALHPLFVEMQQGPVNYAAMWLLMANLQGSISHHFVRWLAGVIHRIDEPRIASLLAKQLNDELGDGNFKQIHSVLLERFVSGLAVWNPNQMPTEALNPGHRLMTTMEHIFENSDVYEGVGALIVSEIFAKKMDRCVADDLQRQSQLSTEVLTWLTLHVDLEVSHAEDSLELAALVPRNGPQLAAVWRGARAEWDALWTFLDQVRATARLVGCSTTASS